MGTVGVPLVLSSQQQQEVLHLHHAVMGAVVRHDCGGGHKIKVSVVTKVCFLEAELRGSFTPGLLITSIVIYRSIVARH